MSKCVDFAKPIRFAPLAYPNHCKSDPKVYEIFPDGMVAIGFREFGKNYAGVFNPTHFENIPPPKKKQKVVLYEARHGVGGKHTYLFATGDDDHEKRVELANSDYSKGQYHRLGEAVIEYESNE